MNNGKVVFPQYRTRIIRRQSKILATGAYLPDKIISNQEIIDAAGLKVTDVAIQKTLGAQLRRVGDDGVVDSDLLAAAAQQALQRAGIHADQLSKILVSKFIGDRCCR